MHKFIFIILFLFSSFSSSVSGEIILADEAKEMFDEHIKQTA